MGTTFPYSIQDFPVMQDITQNDAEFLTKYQRAMEDGDFASAREYLLNIADYDKKILTADLLNSMLDTIDACERFYLKRYSSAYVVSQTQPEEQEIGDFWFEVIS